MDPSVQYLSGHDIPTPVGATIHTLMPNAPLHIDDDKIGFTLDVTMRLDAERSLEATDAQSVADDDDDDENPGQHLADSA
jgi:hypothetical protein